MQAYLTLVRRELGSYFISLTGYVVIAGVLLLMGASLVLLLESLNGQPVDVPVMELFYETQFFWLILLLATPLITMRSFAHEKFAGTYETLMTTPVSDAQVVLAKFTGTMVFYLLAWVPLLTYPALLRHYSTDPLAVDAGPVGSTFLGIFLLGMLYIAMGCFASSLTRSQILAATNAFALGICLFMASFLTRILPLREGWQTKALTHISIIEHMRDFVRGIVDTRHIVFYVSLTAFFLFLTLKVVEARRWR
ncbi:MAG: ABC transporter permease [Verrucomicrobiota bacterium]